MGFSPSFMVKSLSASNCSLTLAHFCALVNSYFLSAYLLMRKELVTRTGFEPMLKA